MEKFDILKEIVENRRTIKSNLMNGRVINDEDINRILSLANYAPTHGLTEPWRFIVYGNEEVKLFCSAHAELYKSETPEERYNESAFEKLMHNGDKASHAVIAYCKTGSNPKIPVIEEICAASCAVQNILLGAEALGFAVYWSTGGMVHNPAMKDLLHLSVDDIILGILYIGYADEKKEGRRKTGIEEKIFWK